jgi:hypothetical protein
MESGLELGKHEEDYPKRTLCVNYFIGTVRMETQVDEDAAS